MALFFAGLGIVLAYRALALLVNTTVITVGPLSLAVRHRPLPWRGLAAIPLTEVLGARVGVQVLNEETLYAVFLVAGNNEYLAFPGFPERQDADRIAMVVNGCINEVRQTPGA